MRVIFPQTGGVFAGWDPRSQVALGNALAGEVALRTAVIGVPRSFKYWLVALARDGSATAGTWALPSATW